MPIKRAILISIVAYAATFVSAIVIGMLFNIGVSSDVETVPREIWIMGAAISVVVMAFSTSWFFKGAGAVPTAQHGAFFGGIAIATGFSLDILTVLPFGNPIEVLGAYYAEPFFVLTLALILLTTTFVGYKRSQRRG